MAQKLSPPLPSGTHAKLVERYYLLTLAVTQSLTEDDLDQVGQLITERERVLVEMERSEPDAVSMPWLQRAVQADEELNLRLSKAYSNMKGGLVQLFREKRSNEAYGGGEAAIHTVEEAA